MWSPLQSPDGQTIMPGWALALAGLQAGVVGGLSALLYLMLDGLLRDHGVWVFPNLLAGVFYPGKVLSLSFSSATVSGLAVHVLMSGLGGLTFYKLLAHYQLRPQMCRLVGLLIGVAWYYVTFRFFWAQMNAAVVLYQPFPGVLFGHVIFGICLGLYPLHVRTLQELEPPGQGSPVV